MKAILEFNLPEEQEEFDQAVRANRVEGAIWQYSQKLREMYKHGDEYTIDTERARQMLFDIFNEHGVDTDLL